MRYNRWRSRYFYTSGKIRLFFFEKQFRENFSVNNKKEMREKVSLSDSLRWLDWSIRASITKKEKEDVVMHGKMQQLNSIQLYQMLWKDPSLQPWSPFSFFLIMYSIISWEVMLSCIFLLGTKDIWKGKATEEMRGLSLIARILEIILQVTLQRFIGPNWSTVDGCLDLVIKITKV